MKRVDDLNKIDKSLPSEGISPRVFFVRRDGGGRGFIIHLLIGVNYRIGARLLLKRLAFKLFLFRLELLRKIKKYQAIPSIN